MNTTNSACTLDAFLRNATRFVNELLWLSARYFRATPLSSFLATHLVFARSLSTRINLINFALWGSHPSKKTPRKRKPAPKDRLLILSPRSQSGRCVMPLSSCAPRSQGLRDRRAAAGSRPGSEHQKSIRCKIPYPHNQTPSTSHRQIHRRSRAPPGQQTS